MAREEVGSSIQRVLTHDVVVRRASGHATEGTPHRRTHGTGEMCHHLRKNRYGRSHYGGPKVNHCGNHLFAALWA